MKKRIYIASFQLETNSFAGALTTMDDYRKGPFFAEGAAIFPKVSGQNTSMGGFRDFLLTKTDVEILWEADATEMTRYFYGSSWMLMLPRLHWHI